MINIFSPHESEILKIIGKRKVTIAEITAEFYAERTKLFDSSNYIASVVRRINRKCDHIKAPWRLAGSGSGRHGRKIWREKR